MQMETDTSNVCQRTIPMEPKKSSPGTRCWSVFNLASMLNNGEALAIFPLGTITVTSITDKPPDSPDLPSSSITESHSALTGKVPSSFNNCDVPVAKKRGRPRKTPETEPVKRLSPLPESCTGNISFTRRKRGRPKKLLPAQDSAKALCHIPTYRYPFGSVLQLPRKRGRPKKVTDNLFVNTSSSENISYPLVSHEVRRKRGRPKKLVTDHNNGMSLPWCNAPNVFFVLTKPSDNPSTCATFPRLSDHWKLQNPVACRSDQMSCVKFGKGGFSELSEASPAPEYLEYLPLEPPAKKQRWTDSAFPVKPAPSSSPNAPNLKVKKVGRPKKIELDGQYKGKMVYDHKTAGKPRKFILKGGRVSQAKLVKGMRSTQSLHFHPKNHLSGQNKAIKNVGCRPKKTSVIVHSKKSAVGIAVLKKRGRPKKIVNGVSHLPTKDKKIIKNAQKLLKTCSVGKKDLSKKTVVPRKRGRPKKIFVSGISHLSTEDMKFQKQARKLLKTCSAGKKDLSEKTVVPRKRGRPKKIFVNGLSHLSTEDMKFQKKAEMPGRSITEHRKDLSEKTTVPRKRGRPKKVVVSGHSHLPTGGKTFQLKTEMPGIMSSFDHKLTLETNVIPKRRGRPKKMAAAKSHLITVRRLLKKERSAKKTITSKVRISAFDCTKKRKVGRPKKISADDNCRLSKYFLPKGAVEASKEVLNSNHPSMPRQIVRPKKATALDNYHQWPREITSKKEDKSKRTVALDCHGNSIEANTLPRKVGRPKKIFAADKYNLSNHSLPVEAKLMTKTKIAVSRKRGRPKKGSVLEKHHQLTGKTIFAEVQKPIKSETVDSHGRLEGKHSFSRKVGRPKKVVSLDSNCVTLDNANRIEEGKPVDGSYVSTENTVSNSENPKIHANDFNYSGSVHQTNGFLKKNVSLQRRPYLTGNKKCVKKSESFASQGNILQSKNKKTPQSPARLKKFIVKKNFFTMREKKKKVRRPKKTVASRHSAKRQKVAQNEDLRLKSPNSVGRPRKTIASEAHKRKAEKVNQKKAIKLQNVAVVENCDAFHVKREKKKVGRPKKHLICKQTVKMPACTRQSIVELAKGPPKCGTSGPSSKRVGRPKKSVVNSNCSKITKNGAGRLKTLQVNEGAAPNMWKSSKFRKSVIGHLPAQELRNDSSLHEKVHAHGAVKSLMNHNPLSAPLSRQRYDGNDGNFSVNSNVPKQTENMNTTVKPVNIRKLETGCVSNADRAAQMCNSVLCCHDSDSSLKQSRASITHAAVAEGGRNHRDIRRKRDSQIHYQINSKKNAIDHQQFEKVDKNMQVNSCVHVELSKKRGRPKKHSISTPSKHKLSR